MEHYAGIDVSLELTARFKKGCWCQIGRDRGATDGLKVGSLPQDPRSCRPADRASVGKFPACRLLKRALSCALQTKPAPGAASRGRQVEYPLDAHCRDTPVAAASN